MSTVEAARSTCSVGLIVPPSPLVGVGSMCGPLEILLHQCEEGWWARISIGII